MPAREYLVDGEQGFIGLNSRDNPVNLGKNYVSKSQNFRMDRGVASVRKGCERLTTGALINAVIYGSCVYTTSTGAELIVLVVSDGLYTYTPDTESVSVKVSFPAGQTITSADDLDVYQAQGSGYVYICRGFSKSTLRWNGSYGTGNIVVPGISTHTNFPNSRHAVYYGNRHIVQTDGNTFSVSHYLQDNSWSALDMFSINDGGNDRLIAITPWTLNEFVIFMRNSIFYASVGVGANVSGDAASNNNSYVKSLATDLGCVARKSVVQAGGGIIFLSDSGVYIANPSGAGQGNTNTPEGMRLLTLAEPLSAPISDVIARINYNYVDKALAIYWENRYYLAVPLDDSTNNNAVLVYNFVNKAWESVDTYTSGFDIKAFHVAKLGSRRRLFGIDQEQGVFLMEELDWDEYDQGVGVPVLPLQDSNGNYYNGETTILVRPWQDPDPYPPSFTLAPLMFIPRKIDGVLITRAYTFETNREKRYSSLQSDIYTQAGGSIDIDITTHSPDISEKLYSFSSGSSNGNLIRIPVRKSAYYCQIKFTSKSLRQTIRSVTLQAVIPGQMTQTKK